MKRILLILTLLLPLLARGQDTVVHDISTGALTIPDSSESVYVLTGTTNSAGNYVHVSRGWRGTIVMRELTMDFPATSSKQSPIRLEGANGGSNATPETEVRFVLEGYNRITNSGHYSSGESGNGRACIQVDVGATAHFQAIDPENDYSGTLCLVQNDKYGGAGIGALARPFSQQECTSSGRTNAGMNVVTHGGNVHISSGIYYCCGGHGAGIGGGHHGGYNNNIHVYYDGAILITGGYVYARCQWHAAGIGSGCPHSDGAVHTYTPNSGIVVLPPAQVQAYGNDDSHNYFPNNHNLPSLGLAGASVIFYCGDPNKPLINVRTADMTPYANIYADLSGDENMVRVCALLEDTIDLSHILLGNTGSRGTFTFHASLSSSTTFFTDAIDPRTGHTYAPFTAEPLTAGGTVTLPEGTAGLALSAEAPFLLMEGYSHADAAAKQYTVVVSNPGQEAIMDFRAELPEGSPFVCTPVHTTLQPGQSYTLDIPLRDNLHTGLYTSQLTFNGTVQGTPLAEQSLTLLQHVVKHQDTLICPHHRLPWGARPDTVGLWLDTMEIYQAVSGEQYQYMCNNWQHNENTNSYYLYDTIVAYTVSFRESSHSYDTVALCPYELPYTHDGHRLEAGAEEGVHDFDIPLPEGSPACDSTVHLYLRLLPVPEVEVVMTGYNCRTGELTLRAMHNGDSVTWTARPEDPDLAGQEHERSIRVSQEGTTYTARVKLGRCEASAELQPEVPRVTLRAAFRHTPQYPPEHFPVVELIDASEGNVGAWEWSTGGTYIGGMPRQPYTFPQGLDSAEVRLVVRHAEYECLDTAYGTIVFGRQGDIWIPNCFTPEGTDNQVFMVKGHDIDQFEMYIFSRKGHQLFHTTDLNQGWDGTANGHPQPQAAYTYLIRYSTTDAYRTPHTKIGTVMLLR